MTDLDSAVKIRFLDLLQNRLTNVVFEEKFEDVMTVQLKLLPAEQPGRAVLLEASRINHLNNGYNDTTTLPVELPAVQAFELAFALLSALGFTPEGLAVAFNSVPEVHNHALEIMKGPHYGRPVVNHPLAQYCDNPEDLVRLDDFLSSPYLGKLLQGSRLQILKDFLDERDRQQQKFPNQKEHPITWATILSEETGEVAKATLGFLRIPDKKFRGNRPVRGFLENPIATDEYYTEMKQVGAVAMAAMELVPQQFPSLIKPEDPEVGQ